MGRGRDGDRRKCGYRGNTGIKYQTFSGTFDHIKTAENVDIGTMYTREMKGHRPAGLNDIFRYESCVTKHISQTSS